MNTLLLSALLLVPGDGWAADVESALVLAGDNRPEIERVLTHYSGHSDARRLEAAEFLVRHMPGHGYVEYGLFDAGGKEVAFDALVHENFDAAQAAMDALEEVHGPLEFRKKELIEDLQTLTAEVLIQNIDLAFEVWESNPWAKGVSFETFCEYLLPHRGSNEPVEDWRTPLGESLREGYAKLEGKLDAAEVAALAARTAKGRVGFSTLYYLHPTDQGFKEMSSARLGRCEDITNMTTYAYRAAAVVAAADYTPYWGHRDNNHAWPVRLDGEGRGKHGDGNRAAKVYRKTYSTQRGNLCFQVGPRESAPRWLDRSTYIDVTDQYGPTADVTVRLQENAAGQRFAYLCVFNGGEWKPIHWGRIATDGSAKVVFERMGLNMLYLPATYVAGEVKPAAAPFYLGGNGDVQPLQASAAFTITAKLYSESPRKPKLDDGGERLSQLATGESYELFAWQSGWVSVRRFTAGSSAPRIDGLPAGGLYWLVRDGSRKLERPFSMRDGEQRFH